MFWLVLSCLMGFGFGQFFKWSQRLGYHAPSVVSTNYLVLSLTLGIALALTGSLDLSPDVLKVGATTGITFVVSMLVTTRAMEFGHVGAILTSFRMAIVVPIALGVWFWQEPIAPIQIAGIALSLLALYLMTRGPAPINRAATGSALLWLLTVFVLQGFAYTCTRWVHYAGLSPSFLSVIAVTGATGGSLGSLFVAATRRRPLLPELRMGAFIGLFNMCALGVTLTTLSIFPGTLFFPITGCTTVLLDNLLGHFHWREPLPRVAMAGAALAVVAILFVTA